MGEDAKMEGFPGPSRPLNSLSSTGATDSTCTATRQARSFTANHKTHVESLPAALPKNQVCPTGRVMSRMLEVSHWESSLFWPSDSVIGKLLLHKVCAMPYSHTS